MPFPPTFDRVFDESFPPDTQLANLLGQDIRNLKIDIRQRLALLSGTLANRPTPEASWGGVGYGFLYFAVDTKQIFQWTGVAPVWVDVSASFKIPVVGLDLTAQQSSIGLTTLVTPAANGLYRASCYLVITQAATVSSTLPGGSISWTDADSSTTVSQNLTNSNTANAVGVLSYPGSNVVTTFLAKVGTPISFSALGYLSSGATPMQYAAHVRLEGPF